MNTANAALFPRRRDARFVRLHPSSAFAAARHSLVLSVKPESPEMSVRRRRVTTSQPDGPSRSPLTAP
eukprot:scaffold50475_cov66-Phaeocystis_antarctica.AAC.11